MAETIGRNAVKIKSRGYGVANNRAQRPAHRGDFDAVAKAGSDVVVMRQGVYLCFIL